MEEYVIDPVALLVVIAILSFVIATLLFLYIRKVSSVSNIKENLHLEKAELGALRRREGLLKEENSNLTQKLNSLEREGREFSAEIARVTTNYLHQKEALEESKEKLEHSLVLSEQLNVQHQTVTLSVQEVRLENEAKEQQIQRCYDQVKQLEVQLEKFTTLYHKTNEDLVQQTANNQSLEFRMEEQKREISKLNSTFQKEFENVANKILEEKTAHFTNSNKVQMEALLKPLDDNLVSFKRKVEEVYDKESKERFSLGEKVKDLVYLNEKLSQEANNLTSALRSDSKAQGGWGEMILESILEQSGLKKDQEYFLENYLKDENGTYLLAEDGKKMRPDAIVKYPDHRNVIIDSKVSLRSYMDAIGTDDLMQQDVYIKQHVSDIKNHINGLSKRGYEQYADSLDFVMMFIPNEPAYMVAVKEDSNLWQYAYERRILLISPTNLIASLKLISDLWSREYQNQNAQKIVDRGEKLYNKFVGFAENFKKVGKGLETAQASYDDAFKQLTTGNDNLVKQAHKLKELRISTKKNVPFELLSDE